MHNAALRTVLEDPISTALGLLAVVIFVLANGFFVATEFALVSVRRTRIQQLAAEGNRRAISVLDRLTHLDTYIAATQLGITISSLALGWIGEPVVAVLVEDVVQYLPFEIGSTTQHIISFTIAFSAVTALHIVIGELAPKSLALQRPEATSLAVSSWIHGFLIIFRPVIYGLNWVGNQVVKMFGIEPAGGHAMVQSTEELMLTIQASREAGLVNQTAHDLVGRAFSFNDLQARHVMVPRTEVTAIPIDATLDDVMQVASDTSHTRLPIYEDDNDHIVGIIKVKRLMPLFLAQVEAQAIVRTARDTAASNGHGPLEGSARQALAVAEERVQTFTVREYMMEPMLVPETLAASDVLTRMREEQIQMAVVIDEYGGTAGIVTLEDLIEEIVGDVHDEHDGAERARVLGDSGGWLVSGLLRADELADATGFAMPDGPYETLAGLVLARLGRLPDVGDDLLVDGRRFTITRRDRNRVAELRLHPEASHG